MPREPITAADLSDGRALDVLRVAVADALRDLRHVPGAEPVVRRLETALSEVDAAILASLREHEVSYKVCTCGRSYTRAQFLALPAPHSIPGDGVVVTDDGYRQTWRQCVCQSTLMTEVAP